jgi:hypothetical protein
VLRVPVDNYHEVVEILQQRQEDLRQVNEVVVEEKKVLMIRLVQNINHH